MEVEQEKDFVSSYIIKAQKGHIVTVLEIKRDFEKIADKKVHKTTIYRLLERHNWMKLVPRSFHPKRDEERLEVFKKTLKTK